MTDKIVGLDSYRRCRQLADSVQKRLAWFDEVSRGQEEEAEILLQGAAWTLRELLQLAGELGRFSAAGTELELQLQRLADNAEHVFRRLEPPA